MTEFLGDANIPSPDSLAQLGGSLPTMALSVYDKHKNRSASRFSGFFFPSYKVRTQIPILYVVSPFLEAKLREQAREMKRSDCQYEGNIL